MIRYAIKANIIRAHLYYVTVYYEPSFVGREAFDEVDAAN